MNKSAIHLQGLSKRFWIAKQHGTALNFVKSVWNGEPLFRRVWALKDISLNIKEGETVCLIGPNGSGKSTLLRLISGIYKPTSGSSDIQGTVAALFNSSSGAYGNLSVLENICLFGLLHGIERAKILASCDQILEAAGLTSDVDVPFKDLSYGQKQRLALTIFLQNPRDILIFDESISYIDYPFRAWSFDQILKLKANSKKTLIFVFHDLEVVKKLADRVIWLHQGSILRDGATSEVVQEYLAEFNPENSKESQ